MIPQTVIRTNHRDSCDETLRELESEYGLIYIRYNITYAPYLPCGLNLKHRSGMKRGSYAPMLAGAKGNNDQQQGVKTGGFMPFHPHAFQFH